MNPDDLYKHLQIDKEAVTGFFIFFSRFEYSLKRIREYAKQKNTGVEADWDRFAKDHNNVFDDRRTSELERAVKYLQEYPPRKQILNEEGTLDVIPTGWKCTPVQNIPLLPQLILSVKRVRNNLFHGGKFHSGDFLDQGRNTELIENCMVVLKECLRLDEHICTVFHE
jgi:hypothetical protein